MKVERSSAKQTPVPDRGGLLRSLGRVAMLLAVVLVLVIGFVLVTNPLMVQGLAADLEARWGYQFRKADATLTEKAIIAVGNYLRDARDEVPPVPELVFDVPFKEMSKIYAKRQEALERGILIQGPDDFIKAEIRHEDRVIPVKMRLKGDWTDHLYGIKWSFRVHLRNNEQLFGLRRFSIQNPSTRGYQSELLFFELLDRYGVMRPRYEFVNVVINGGYW